MWESANKIVLTFISNQLFFQEVFVIADRLQEHQIHCEYNGILLNGPRLIRTFVAFPTKSLYIYIYIYIYIYVYILDKQPVKWDTGQCKKRKIFPVRVKQSYINLPRFIRTLFNVVNSSTRFQFVKTADIWNRSKNTIRLNVSKQLTYKT